MLETGCHLGARQSLSSSRASIVQEMFDQVRVQMNCLKTPHDITVQYARLIHQLVMKALSTVRDIDPQNDLPFLRVLSKKNEIMIAPVKNYFFIVMQNPSD
uniref:Dynein, light chain, roadblock-type 1 n=1 Tax=Salmo trutta TaxID=8032 RepID=A0A674EAZ4_SALTR